ncbi:MAG: shikimate kinase [Bacteroidota bacterium]
MYPDKIFLIGFMGVGKSYWGVRLAKALSYEFVDLDLAISNQAGGLSVSEIFDARGEASFRELEASCLLSFIESPQKGVIACGGGTPCFFTNLERMKDAGWVIWLQASLSVLIPRLLLEREQRPLIREMDEEQLRKFIDQKMAERLPFYSQAHKQVQESALTDVDHLQTLLHE